MTQLLASSPTINGIENTIRDLYFGVECRVTEKGEVIRISDEKKLPSVRVTQHDNRCFFERI